MEDIARLHPADQNNLAFVTQTTLSVDDTQDMVEALKARFPSIVGPHKEDICATTNRQGAVKRVAPMVDAMIVVGSPGSSNSQRLREVAERRLSGGRTHPARRGHRLVPVRHPPSRITAGASAPEILVEEIIDAFAERYVVSVESVSTADESVFFPLPRELREHAAEEVAVYTEVPDEEPLSLPRHTTSAPFCPTRASPRRGEHELLSPHHRRILHPDPLREAGEGGGPALLPRARRSIWPARA